MKKVEAAEEIILKKKYIPIRQTEKKTVESDYYRINPSNFLLYTEIVGYIGKNEQVEPLVEIYKIVG